MKPNVIRVLKEIGIFVAIFVLLIGVAVFAFHDQMPLSKEIPKSISYTNIDNSDYSVEKGGVEDETLPLKRYEENNVSMEVFATEKRYLPGKVNPFGSPSSSYSDLPAISPDVEANPDDSGVAGNEIDAIINDATEQKSLVDSGLSEKTTLPSEQ